jgi:hypothetical protein
VFTLILVPPRAPCDGLAGRVTVASRLGAGQGRDERPGHRQEYARASAKDVTVTIQPSAAYTVGSPRGTTVTIIEDDQ